MHKIEQNKKEILGQLEKHQPADSLEATHKSFICNFVEQNEVFSDRKNQTGHLTTSAWILNKDRTKVLMIHHYKLNRWLQPGGHVEPEDQSLFDGALREALEETNLQSIVQSSTDIFDVDVHRIPERKSEPEHNHLDIRFVFEADDTEPLVLSSEVNQIKWVDLNNFDEASTEQSILRMVRKSQP